ncbi:MAG: amidohydrolase [Oscillatoriaceae bacterium SKW80]|nr:amidohydrolase [Oscillatoriaceae bacterium SKYG93]MCX8122129.1 amidohydrolase [Oscillatoriaceae bacterium SKW80]MDW8454416.1 amidohydrolase [Oscillatoriaceae cyanobacterium SKYGB_i_bin93]HIK29280.1 amidohydrolase [Oscillatoriaceae cyanobacterium M7585_C2015_266]
MSFTIQQALIPVENGYTTADVQIVGERLVAIAPKLEIIGTVVSGENKLLLPGFVNAHTHSSEIWQRGALRPFPLELWLAELYEFPPLQPEQIYLSALVTATETLLSGGTSIVDHLVLIPGKEIESITQAIRAYKEIGIRVFMAPLIYDELLDAGLPSGNIRVENSARELPTAETLALILEAVNKFHNPQECVSVLVAPTGIQLCSDKLFEGCIELSDRYNLCRHSHLLETKAQQLIAQEKYGCSAVEHLKNIGYLSQRTSLAHCVWLSERDINILAETGATVVHNPLSNLRLGSGIAPIIKYLKAGVNVSFACDGASSNDSQDLLEAIKIGSLLHNVTTFDYRDWISPRQAVEMASLGGAKGLNLENEIGSLTVGKKADIVLYDLTNLSLLPRTDPIGLLVRGRPTNVVDSVWVNGERIVADGKPTRINIDELRRELWERSQVTGERPISNAVRELEAHYRRVMGLNV